MVSCCELFCHVIDIMIPDQAFGVPEHVKETNRLHWIEKDAVAPTTVEAAPPVATVCLRRLTTV